MRLDYGKIVMEIRNLSFEDKQEIKSLVEKYIVEERREEMRVNYRKSRFEAKKGRLTFAASVAELQKTL